MDFDNPFSSVFDFGCNMFSFPHKIEKVADEKHSPGLYLDTVDIIKMKG